MGLSVLAISAGLAILAQAAPASPPAGPADATRAALGPYMHCQLAAVRALDDGKSTEDAIATQAEKRCEAEYQAYRQAWSLRDGPGTPEQRTWSLDNGRQERGRIAVHAHRQALAHMAEIKTCVRRVADEFKAEPFDQILDQGVLKCGALVPFPVPPRGLDPTMSEQQVHDRKDRQDRQDRMTRTMIATELRQIVKPAGD